MATNGEIIRCVVKYSAANSGIGNTVHIYQVTGGNPSDQDVIDALDNFVDNNWAPHWEPIASINSEIYAFEADVLTTGGLVARNLGGLSYTTHVGDIGTNAPAQTCGLLIAETAVPKVRGRKYLPYLSQSNLDIGLWDSTALAAFADLLADYLSTLIITVGVELIAGVLSRSLVDFVPFNGTGFARAIPRTQRRRTLGYGS